MLIDHKADGIVAFHMDIEHSKGTKNMVEQAIRAGKPVYICVQPITKFLEFITALKKIQAEKGK